MYYMYKYIYIIYIHIINMQYFRSYPRNHHNFLLGSAALIQQGIAKTSLVADDFLGSSD